MESLLVTPISKASAKQRAGRAGRTREGKCIRLYTKDAYEELEKTCYPEILRSNLSTVVLTLLRLGVTDIVHFDFMDPPAPETMMRAIELLHYMGAIDEEGHLTDIGKTMSLTPLDPELSKVLLSSKKYKCINEVLTIVSMLSVPGVFSRPRQMQTCADDAKKKFIHSSGDHITLLIAYNSFKLNKEAENYCKKNFLNYKNLKNADSVRNQLERMLINEGIIPPENEFPIEFNEKKVGKILKAMLSGCFAQVCCLELAGYYTTVRENQMVLMHPSTSLSYKPSWVLYQDFVCTGKNYIRTLSRIDPEWLFKIAPQYYNIDEFTDGRVKRELKKVLIKMSNETDHANIEKKEEEEENRNLKLKEINEEIIKNNTYYSKYSAIKKYKVTK
jgi:HrpA-like RNA helicase